VLLIPLGAEASERRKDAMDKQRTFCTKDELLEGKLGFRYTYRSHSFAAWTRIEVRSWMISMTVLLLLTVANASVANPSITFDNPSQDGYVARLPCLQVQWSVDDPCHPIERCELYMDGQLVWERDHDPPEGGHSHGEVIELWDKPNGDHTLKARAICTANHTGQKTRTITINHNLLYSVTRNERLIVKWWTGNGWLVAGCRRWEFGPLLTTGAGHAHSAGQHTGDDHRYCNKADTPPYRGNPPSNNPSPEEADRITSRALSAPPENVWDHGTPNDPSDDVSFWRSSIEPRSCMGHYKIPLPNKTAETCGCYRTAILIHGGGPKDVENEQGISAVMQHSQTLHSTYGCIRMVNGCPHHHIPGSLADLAYWHNRWYDLGKPIHIFVPVN
jgi:hypothetical protein